MLFNVNRVINSAMANALVRCNIAGNKKKKYFKHVANRNRLRNSVRKGKK